MNGTWKHSLEPSIDFCQVLCNFYQVLSQVCDFLHKLCKSTYKFTHKNYVLAPIVGKDLEQKFFWGFVLGAL